MGHPVGIFIAMVALLALAMLIGAEIADLANDRRRRKDLDRRIEERYKA